MSTMLVLESFTYSCSQLLDAVDSSDFKVIFAIIVGDTKSFYTTIFEQQVGHFQATKTGSLSIVDKERLLQLFSQEVLLKLAKTQSLPVETNIQAYKYIKGCRKPREFKNEIIQVSEIESVFKNGNSCQFYQPQRFTELHVLNAGFEYVFGTLAGASAYLTPASAQGLAPHHDDVDVFIIQTEGTKEWHLWKGEMDLPEHHSADIERDALPNPPTVVILNAGDILYLPRGTIHEAIAQDTFSTHATISLFQKYNMKTMLSGVIENVLEQVFETNIELRRGLPIRIGESFGSFAAYAADSIDAKQKRDLLLAQIKALATSLIQEIKLEDIDDTVDDIVCDFKVNRLPPPGDDFGSEKKRKRHAELTISSKVRLFDPLCCHFQMVEEDGVQLLSVTHNRCNDRLRHMGHPLGDEGEDSDNSTAGELILPLRMRPIVKALYQEHSTGYTAVEKLVQMVKVERIDSDEVMETCEAMREGGFLLVE